MEPVCDFLAPVTSSQLIFVVGGIYFVTGIVFFLSKLTSSRIKDHNPNHNSIPKLGAASANVMTDIFLILWLHDNHSELDDLMYLSLIALCIAFFVGLVRIFLKLSDHFLNFFPSLSLDGLFD